MPHSLDIERTREALSSSTLSHGLKLLGDRWTMQVLLGAFMGVRRFDDWQVALRIPRHTLADRIRALVQMDLLRPRLYQERPERYAYHLTQKGLALYDTVLMTWEWEQRYGDRNIQLPTRLVHQSCGHAFHPELTCSACGEAVQMTDLSFFLKPNARLPHDTASPLRTPRMSSSTNPGMGLGLRVDRWSLLIVSALVLGCHYFDQISAVLRIGPSVLTRRLGNMIESGLLQCQVDRRDARRRVYRLTAASRGLFGYIVSMSTWASVHHFHEPSSIRPRHDRCGHAFVPRVACGHCHQPLQPWEVTFDMHKGVLP
jgi:DNA-binding HxlR family transcriptional regulator